MRQQIRAAGLVSLALMMGVIAACGRQAADTETTVVARLGERPLYLAELTSYLRDNMPELSGGEEPAEEALERVKSRLLDALVEERLLLVEAERRGLVVEDWEVAAYIGMDEEEESGADAEVLARRRLMVQKLREGTILSLPPLTDGEIARYAEQHGERLMSERRLELRALMLESEEKAKKVYRDIRRRRITFTEAVVAYEKYPGQGRPIPVAWSGLSEEVRAALEKLKVGQVSQPVEMQGDFYLFKIESWINDPERLAAERLHRARRELEDLRRQQALEELLAELRERNEVRLELRRLPFRYRP
jgi:foldase protein PrsA